MLLVDEDPQPSGDDLWRNTVLHNIVEAQSCTRKNIETLHVYKRANKANPKDRKFMRSRSAFISPVR